MRRRQLGYALLLTNSDGNLAKERRNIRNLAARQVDGVVLASVLFEPDLADLETAEIPSVLLSHSASSAASPRWAWTWPKVPRTAVEHLIGHGHTNIGLAMGTTTGNEADAREEGWLQALREAGLPEGPIARSAFTRVGGYAAGQRLLASGNRPTAIFASSDMQAIGILRALHEAGLSVPGDIALASFDGSAEAEYSLADADHRGAARAGHGRGRSPGARRGGPRRARTAPRLPDETSGQAVLRLPVSPIRPTRVRP